MKIDLSRYRSAVAEIDTFRLNGRVKQVIGLVIEADGPSVSVGEVCLIEIPGSEPVRSEVVGFRDNSVLLMPLGVMHGISPGCPVVATGSPMRLKVGSALLGRVLNALGEPMDGKGPIREIDEISVENQPPLPLERRRITEVLPMGVRAIDGCLTIGKGQRMGIFSGSGVGKSTLLGMICRNTTADVNVIALIGERGREVKEFLERDLGDEGLKRSVVVCATGDQPALIRIKGALTAHAIAEYFRDQGKDVNLLFDSVTRLAVAQREVGLAIGEPPTTRGYTPSVFALLPKLLERSGTNDRGTITGLYTVLVEADDMNEPVADAIRAILDGHIVLSRDIAAKNHYPPIDVLTSVSRVMIDVVPKEHRQVAGKLRDILAVYARAQDLIHIGAYVPGSDPKVDHAISMIDKINEFLVQDIEEKSSYETTIARLLSLFDVKGGVVQSQIAN